MEQIIHVNTPVLPTSISVAALSISVVLGAIAIIAVALRIWAQKTTKAGITIDAYLIIGSLVITVGLCILCCYMATNAGLGWPIEWLAGPVNDLFQSCLDAHQVISGISIVIIRASLLCFYRRIFTTAKFHKMILAAHWFNGVMGAIFVMVTGMATVSSSAIVTKSTNLINIPVWLIAYICIDIAQDLVVLCFPFLVIRKLNMSTRRKVGLVGLFWLGIFCVIASVTRLAYFVELYNTVSPPEFLDKTALCTIWSTIQPCTSIIAACLPTYGPLLKGESNLIRRISSKLSSLARGTRHSVDRHTDSKIVRQEASDIALRDNPWERVHSENSSQIEGRSERPEAYLGKPELYDQVNEMK